MTIGWTEATLGELSDAAGGVIQSGPFGSQLHQSDYQEVGIPVVMPKDIVDSRIASDSIARITEEMAQRLGRHRLQPGDIVYARRGDIGRRAFVEAHQTGWLCGTGCLRLSLGHGIVDPRFLFYYLGLPHVVKAIANQAVGSTMPNLNTSILRSVPIRFPPLTIQRRLVEVLSAYDNLIENNTRRIKLLEQMAELIYREWFVNFRFPGHEDVEMVESELGMVPEGWRPYTIGELLDSDTGGDWGKEEPMGTETNAVRVIRGTDIPNLWRGDSKSVPLRYIRKTSMNTRRLQPGDVVIENSVNASSRSVGTSLVVTQHTLNLFQVNAIAASFCKQYRPIEQTWGGILHYHLKYLRKEALMEKYQNVAANGIANFQSARFKTEHHIILPDSPEIISSLATTLSVLVERITLLARKNANLRQTRDMLLPKLISGEVDVSELKPEDDAVLS
jgi:type I restriction enzyme, S subunit